MTTRACQLTIPAWLDDAWNRIGALTGSEERMAFVIQLAQENVSHATGGPFGAAVFEADSGQLVAPGVNQVVPLGLSIAHAEIVAISLAQKTVGTYDLGQTPDHQYELVTSVEPCAMCFGAIPWSGLRRLVCGARDADAREIGFDEGPKLPDWQKALEARGILVVRDLMRQEARRVLHEYAVGGGRIYNSREG